MESGRTRFAQEGRRARARLSSAGLRGIFTPFTLRPSLPAQRFGCTGLTARAAITEFAGQPVYSSSNIRLIGPLPVVRSGSTGKRRDVPNFLIELRRRGRIGQTDMARRLMDSALAGQLPSLKDERDGSPR